MYPLNIVRLTKIIKTKEASRGSHSYKRILFKTRILHPLRIIQLFFHQIILLFQTVTTQQNLKELLPNSEFGEQQKPRSQFNNVV